MSKLKRPRGLVRYSSQARIAGEPGGFARPRLFAYSAVLLAIFAVFVVLAYRSRPTDVTILRGMGAPFTTLSTGEVANPLRIKMTNRTREPRSYRVEIDGAASARLLSSGFLTSLQPAASVTRDLAIAVPSSVFVFGKHKIRLNIIDDKQSVTQVEYELLGPQHNPVQLGSKVPANAGPEY